MSALKRISMRPHLFMLSTTFPIPVAMPSPFIDIFQPDISSCFMHSALEFATNIEIPPLAACFCCESQSVNSVLTPPKARE